ncbi:hypothetical protein VP01_9971g1, partial [Puccinia sorghi]
AFNDAGKSFCEQGLSLSWDEMQGLIIQTNLRGNLCQALDQKIDLFMAANDQQTPPPQDVFRLLDAAWIEQQLFESSRVQEAQSLHTTLASRNTSSDSCVAGPQDHQEIEVNAVGKRLICYICKKPDHIAPNCPQKKRGNPP